VLRENGRMLELVRKLGYAVEPSDEFRATRLGKHVPPERGDL
jgi:hypothetical protein